MCRFLGCGRRRRPGATSPAPGLEGVLRPRQRGRRRARGSSLLAFPTPLCRSPRSLGVRGLTPCVVVLTWFWSPGALPRGIPGGHTDGGQQRQLLREPGRSVTSHEPPEGLALVAGAAGGAGPLGPRERAGWATFLITADKRGAGARGEGGRGERWRGGDVTFPLKTRLGPCPPAASNRILSV